MAEEIVNRVANSKLKVIDLEELYPEGPRTSLDIKDWLYEGLVLREKDFRTYVSDYDWSQYKGTYVALYCSTDAIIPDWAYLLVATHLQPYAKYCSIGTIEQLNTLLYKDIIANINVSEYEGLPTIIKGCANKPVPDNALLMLTQKLQPVAKSIMYGEACSAVPLFKKKA